MSYRGKTCLARPAAHRLPVFADTNVSLLCVSSASFASFASSAVKLWSGGIPMFERFRSRQRYAYSRWDGSQKLDDLDAEDILDALSDDYMRTGDLRKALERMMQQGFMGRDGMRRMGMQDLMDRLKQMRQQ